MSVQKERKIHKLRRKKIWPLIIFMILVIFCFVVLDFFLIDVITIYIIDSKMNQSDIVAQKISKMISDCYDKNGGKDIDGIADTVRKLYDKNSDICIYDKKNHQLIKQYGKTKPDFKNHAYLGIECQFDIYMEDMTGVDFDAQKEGLVINPIDIITPVFRAFVPSQSMDSDWLATPVLSATYWSSNPIQYQSYNVLVKQELLVRRSEIIYVIIIAFLGFVCMLIPLLILFGNMVSTIVMQRRMTKLYYLNPITGGNNFTYFKEQGARIFHKRRNNDQAFAVVNLHWCKYDSYCSYYGAENGEEMLEAFSQIGQSMIPKHRSHRQSEVAAHHSKANFALLLRFTNEQEMTDRIQRMCREAFEKYPDRRLQFYAGVYIIEPATTKEQIQARRKIDLGTLYSYAATARNTLEGSTGTSVAFFNDEMREQQQWEHQVEDRMESALKNHEFQVYLQPKYSTIAEVVSGAEALVRWILPDGKLIPPNRFIPIFEKNGFIISLDDFMISEVAKQQAEWIKQGYKVVPVSVNVSRAHFTKEDLAEHICELVDVYEVPHDVIELELTESAFFDDKNMLLKTVLKLKEAGFAVSMDDFGSGYSSLNSLKDLPLDVVKLDAEFFRGENKEKRGEIVVSEAIQLAKQLNMKIVAEGIETREQVDFLAKQGCDLIQGYYFAKPMPICEYENSVFK